jgi:hypothetical protein
MLQLAFTVAETAKVAETVVAEADVQVRPNARIPTAAEDNTNFKACEYFIGKTPGGTYFLKMLSHYRALMN